MMQEQATLMLLIRHGETPWNVDARIQGHTDIELNARGHAQAQAVARALAGTAVDAVYSSDLLRARQTAGPIAAAFGHALRLEPALRERSFGAFEGYSFAQLQERDPERCERWRRRDPDFAAPGGERLDAFHDRVADATLGIAAAHPGQTVVVVSHGGALDSLYRLATGQDLVSPRTWEVRNCAINRVLVSDGRMTLVGWNDLGHLETARDEQAA